MSTAHIEAKESDIAKTILMPGDPLRAKYIAEKYFGIADITGAYVAGIILCSIRDSEYIAEKMDSKYRYICL